MPSRAFIIAIQNYQDIQEGLGPVLEGTHKYALKFRDWVIADQGVDPADVFFCTDSAALPGRTAGASRSAIKSELFRLKEAGKDQTQALYFFFSGHGFSYVDGNGAPVTDVLLAGDYVKREISGDACLRLAEIQQWLYMCLGPGDHYYFIEACRNELTEKDIQPIPLGLAYDPSFLARPTRYTLYSARQGDLTVVDGRFPEALIEGLKGAGRAKTWRGNSLAVLFDSVRAYTEKRLAKSLDPERKGSSEGVIREFPPPPPTFTCRITINGAGPTDRFTAVVRNARGQQIDRIEIEGGEGTFQNVPDDYYVQVTAPPASGLLVGPREPVLADLYEDCTLQFTSVVLDGQEAILFEGHTEGARAFGAPAAPKIPLVDLEVHPPDGGAVLVHHLQRGETIRVERPEQHQIPPARYAFETVDRRGTVIDRQERDVQDGDAPVRIDRRNLEPGALRHSVASAFYRQDGALFMSETLGAVVDQGLDLWLALLGASRLLGPRHFSKLGPLPLTTFGAWAGNAPIYLLAGLNDPALAFAASVSSDWRAAPEPLARHPQFPGLFERVDAGDGARYRYVNVQVADRAPVVFGVYTAPARGTLVTLTLDARGALNVQQFLLPLDGVAAGDPMPPLTGTGSEPEELSQPLRVVQRAVELERAFAAARDLRTVLTPAALDALLEFRWVEPVVAIQAAYDALRRGERQLMPVLLGNLTRFLPHVGDTHALARMSRLSGSPAMNPPLVLEGYEALNFETAAEAPPRDTLLFTGPWTMWSATRAGR